MRTVLNISQDVKIVTQDCQVYKDCFSEGVHVGADSGASVVGVNVGSNVGWPDVGAIVQM